MIAIAHSGPRLCSISFQRRRVWKEVHFVHGIWQSSFERIIILEFRIWSIDVYRRATIASRKVRVKTKNFFPSSRNRVFRDRVESDYFLLVNVVKGNNWARGGASGGARSSDVKLIGKSVTRPRRSSLLLASGKTRGSRNNIRGWRGWRGVATTNNSEINIGKE